MSGTELLVIAFGLFIGYWVVSQLGSSKKPNSKNVPNKSETNREAQGREYSAEPEPLEEKRTTPETEDAAAPWHQVLNVAPDADPQEIRRAYQSLISQYHPDKVASLGSELRELCERKSKEINKAYDRAMLERGFERC